MQTASLKSTGDVNCPMGFDHCKLRERSHIVTNVNWLRIVAVVGLLALWLPATSHALLEQADWIHHHDDDTDQDHGSANGHDAADGICRIESNSVHAPNPVFHWVATLVVAASFAAQTVTLADAPAFSGPSPPGTAPPHLISRWQFSHRAAVPVRAPSIAS